MKQQTENSCFLLHVGFLLGLSFDHEDENDIFIRNIGWLATSYKALLFKRTWYFSLLQKRNSWPAMNRTRVLQTTTLITHLPTDQINRMNIIRSSPSSEIDFVLHLTSVNIETWHAYILTKICNTKKSDMKNCSMLCTGSNWKVQAHFGEDLT
jgi:hypothetical protein